jgi:hypothetical protein
MVQPVDQATEILGILLAHHMNEPARRLLEQILSPKRVAGEKEVTQALGLAVTVDSKSSLDSEL